MVLKKVRKVIKFNQNAWPKPYIHMNIGLRKKHFIKNDLLNLLAIEMKKAEILMNKPTCLGLSILQLSKILMYEFSYDYVKAKYSEKAKLCYMNTDSFILYIKTDDIDKDNAKNF